MNGKKDRLWIFTFEYAGIAKVGGLGEVPANQAKNLVNKFDVTVFIPSHGQIERLTNITECEKLPFSAAGQLDFSLLGTNELESSYKISFYKCRLNGVTIILLAGDNSFTNKYLNDKSVYNPETITGKISLFGIGMRCYIEHVIDNQKELLPDIIHLHDYHVVIPFINIKQELTKNGLDIPSIITIHLLTWPRYEIDFYKACGIEDVPITILLKDGIKSMTFDSIFALCEDKKSSDGDYYPPTVEKIGAVVCDLVTTVSQSYLQSDIIPNCGQELIEFKSDFIWDGCDWEYKEINDRVFQTLGKEMREVLNISHESQLTLEDAKKYLLTYKLSHLTQSPLINSSKVLDIINEISNGNEFVKNGNIKAFNESGYLVLTTGRISHQKGFETIFEAIPEIIKIIPNIKFLFLVLPTEYSLNEIETYAQHVKKYPENLRIIFGVAADIFYLAHIVADVYCALSRWEPFGIMALEAMATKTPIIATKVGGLQESVIDIRKSPEKGTGLLIEKDNPSQLVNALISLLKLKELSEKTHGSNKISQIEILKVMNQIPDAIIKSKAYLDANYYNKIKENCYERVNNFFRWNIVSKKLIELYIKLKQHR
ncbi:MAG: glycosyltransferase [Promethearchaeota archaeon]